MDQTQTSIPTIRFMQQVLEVALTRYAAAPQTAIILYHQATGEQWCVASVCLSQYRQAADEVYVKNWSENEGLLDALVAGGIVENTGRVLPTGFVQANVCRLLVPAPAVA